MAQIKEQQLEAYLVDNQAMFYRLAFSQLRNQEDALDAVQTAVCKALEYRHSLRNADALRSWFYRILMNACTDILRQRGRSPLPFDETLHDAGYEDPLPKDADLYQQVEALPESMGAVIRLRFYHELSLKEISEVTGVHISTVKTRLYGALKKLRITFEGEEWL